MTSQVIFQIQSTLILILFYYGIFHKKNRDKHVKIMKTAIIWDILLVLQIELTRGAIEKASKVVSNPAILNFHVAIAVGSVVGFVIMWALGSKILKGRTDLKPIHKNIGFVTILLRTMTYITSYLVAS